MKRVMYLHGLESSNVCDKVDFLRERAEVLAPSIDLSIKNFEILLNLSVIELILSNKTLKLFIF
jgi:hypothetical protein